jgi:DNA-3-methyladenine glycosylase II
VKRQPDLGEAERYLMRVCPAMRKHVPHHAPYPLRFERSKDPYRALIRAVVYQQLSGKAAGTIYQRLLALYDKPHPEPVDILETPDEHLRAAGLSR